LVERSDLDWIRLELYSVEDGIQQLLTKSTMKDEMNGRKDGINRKSKTPENGSQSESQSKKVRRRQVTDPHAGRQGG